MKVNVVPLASPSTFSAFTEREGLEVEVRERSKHQHRNLPRYYAWAPKVEVMVDGGLLSTFGDGESPEEAVVAYAAALAGCRIAVDAWTPSRRELQLPNEWLPEEEE